jgi:hypothetical protein
MEVSAKIATTDKRVQWRSAVVLDNVATTANAKQQSGQSDQRRQEQ